jgi:hypothetical protein
MICGKFMTWGLWAPRAASCASDLIAVRKIFDFSPIVTLIQGRCTQTCFRRAMNRTKSNEVPRGSPCKINANHGIQCSPKEDASPQKSNEIPRHPLQNGRVFFGNRTKSQGHTYVHMPKRMQIHASHCNDLNGCAQRPK